MAKDNENKNQDELNLEDLSSSLDGKNSDGQITISTSKLVLAKKLLENIKENSNRVLQLISPLISESDEKLINVSQISELNEAQTESADGSKIIEGVFDGENMIGPDGKQYSVPANYASKSKLVEGDILKLTITNSGTFVYKQIGPIERSRVIGALEKDAEGNFIVLSEGKKWKVLTASVTYFKGNAGDEVVLLIPKAGESRWGTVENIISNKF